MKFTIELDIPEEQEELDLLLGAGGNAAIIDVWEFELRNAEKHKCGLLWDIVNDAVMRETTVEAIDAIRSLWYEMKGAGDE